MTIEIRLAQLAGSMTSGKVSVWLKREGDPVRAGEPIAEVETEKSSVEIESPASGMLHKILVPAGTEDVKVGSVLATIREADAIAPEKAVEAAATPLARHMAAIAGVEIAGVAGTGQGGRIVKVDVERTLYERGLSDMLGTSDVAVPPVSRAPEPTPRNAPRFEERPLSGIRLVTAARTLHAKQTVPHFYLRIECRVEGILDARTRIKAGNPDLSVTITDFVVRAAALALRKVPEANATWVDNALRVYDTADIAVAVATTHGLLTPIVREADRKGVAAISRELRELTDRARSGRLMPEEYTGGTFTISNLGMYGVESLFPIVNPPQICILGIGAAQPRPIVRDGVLAVGQVMTCTLSADHRAIDGATGASLLAAFKASIEEPWLLVI